MSDALTFSALWTVVLGTVFAVPLSIAFVYSAVRGGMTARETRLRQLYRLVLEEEIYGSAHCFACGHEVEDDWLVCPACTAQLRGRCQECETLVKPHWSACPHCASSLDEPLPVPVSLPAAA